MSIIGTRQWGVIRAYVLDRDRYRCRMMTDGLVCNAYADTVQHVIRREHGGGDELSNLVAACAGCNYGERSSIPPAPPRCLSARAVLVVAALDAVGAPTTLGRRRALPILVRLRPGEKFSWEDIDTACRWRRHRGPLGRL